MFRQELSGGPCRPCSAGNTAGAGGRWHPARVRRRFRREPSAIGPATPGHRRPDALSHRRPWRFLAALRALWGGDHPARLVPQPALPQVPVAGADPMGRRSVYRSARHRLCGMRLRRRRGRRCRRTPLDGGTQGNPARATPRRRGLEQHPPATRHPRAYRWNTDRPLPAVSRTCQPDTAKPCLESTNPARRKNQQSAEQSLPADANQSGNQALR